MNDMAALHPVTVHFPIVLLLLYILFETMGAILKKDFLQKSAYIILAIAIIASLAAVFTGDQALKAAEAWDKSRTGEKNIPLNIIDQHKDFATITLWYYTGLLIARTALIVKKKFDGLPKYGILLLAIAGGFLIFRTGSLGGELVYKHRVGTEVIIPIDTLTWAPIIK